MQKRNITYSSDRSSLLDELLLLIWGKSSLYQLIFFQKRTVWSPHSLFVVSMSTRRLTWLFTYERAWAARGRDRIRNNELDWKDWTSCWFHMDYFITECFSIRLTSFESRHFKLSIDTTPMSVCWVFAELVHFSDVFLKAVRGDGEDGAHPVCFLFFSKTTKFCCNRECTQKK